MEKKYNEEVLLKGIKAFREGYIRDINRFGEDYWKEKLLNKFGEYESNGIMWSDYYPEEISVALDENCPSILILASILINEFN